MSFVSVEVKPSQVRRVRERFSRRKRDQYERVIANGTAAGGVAVLEAIRANINKQGLIVTGQYLNSWHLYSNPQTGGTTVRSDHPAARRLEYGFTGRDASGRMYHDPPRPHVRPGVAQARSSLVKSIRTAIETEAKK